jgi:hypothetical protein
VNAGSLDRPSPHDRIRTDTYALATPAGRKPGTAGHVAAREYVQARFAELGLAPYRGADDYRHAFVSGDGITMTNLVGVVPGSDRSLPPVLIGAHYDSVIQAPCADDNAAAVAVMLAAAERLAAEPLERDVLVVAFDAEEPPYFLSRDMGSNRFVEDVLAEQVHLAVILDLVGHTVRIPGVATPPDLVFVTGAESHPALPGLLDDLDLPIAAAAQRAVGDFSDYAAFRQAGAPYLFFSGGEWEHYHRYGDHPDLMDYAKMTRLAADLERVIRRADSVATGYHTLHDCTAFEVATLERTLGTQTLAAAAAMLGLPDYHDADHLTRIIHGLRTQLA